MPNRSVRANLSLVRIAWLQIKVCFWGAWYSISGDFQRAEKCDLLYDSLEQEAEIIEADTENSR